MIKNIKKGFFLEEIIDRTINYYNKNNIGIFTKKETPLKIHEINSSIKIKYVSKAIFTKKSTVDYYGIYKSELIEIEAKETWQKDYFQLSYIKEHQLSFLKKIEIFGGKGILIIYSHILDNFFILKISSLVEFMDKNPIKKHITWVKMKKIAVLLKISYPGIIDFLKLL